MHSVTVIYDEQSLSGCCLNTGNVNSQILIVFPEPNRRACAQVPQ